MSIESKTWEGTAQFLVVLALLIFLPAWSLSYWRGWLFLIVFAACVVAMNAYLLKFDPALAERRMKAGPGSEKEPEQKRIQAIAGIFFFLLAPVSALDHGYGWSSVPPHLSLLGDGVMVLGFALVLAVFKENSFASATIETTETQRVVSTGPYGVVRHPMYSGALLIVAGVPLALGSFWGLLVSAAIAVMLVWRLLHEENYLRRHLPGYGAYARRTRYRLVPGIF